MRVSDWRTASGLDVVAHVLFDSTGVNRDTLRALMEARRWMLAVAAGLAAERRSDAQAGELVALARVAAREQTADFTFFAGLVEASGNLVFQLILNSVRPVYFEHAAFFDGLITDDQQAMYVRAAEAVRAGDAQAAEDAVAELAERQERALAEALG
jgi:DNA-binding FadR family transcriptional regulator